jgi:hypothetical protein
LVVVAAEVVLEELLARILVVPLGGLEGHMVVVVVLTIILLLAGLAQLVLFALSGPAQLAVSHQQTQAIFKEQLCGLTNKLKASLPFMQIFAMSAGKKVSNSPAF